MASKKMNVKERQVYEVALQCVGGVENSIEDGCWDGEIPSEDELFEMCLDDVHGECPREVRFLGSKRIEELCRKAAREFEVW